MRTCIIFKSDDYLDSDWKKGEMGYIDGYIYGNECGPLAAIIKEDGNIVLCSPYSVKVIMEDFE